jgi:hypothetical protein
LKSQVAPASLISSGACSYVLLSFFRALHHMTDSPQHYLGLNSHWLWTPSVTSFDPLFVCPVLFGLGNFWLLRQYQHPLTVHWSDRTKLLIGFSSSLLSVLWPVLYFQAWGSFWLTHLLLHKISFRYRVK